jgi:chemotaxis protein methyltransferase CheR
LFEKSDVPLEDMDYSLFIRKLKEYTSIDLSLYKEVQMKRRLTTLRDKRGYPTFVAYLAALRKEPELLNEFYDRMTINVSEFWRNSNRWKTLMEQFLPEMLARRPGLKCWSAACSTGEEPYTLAMILASMGALRTSRIFASDIDEGAMNQARKGIYADRSLRDMPLEYRQKYMKQVPEGYAINDDLKKSVLFQKQNLLEDPFDSQFDLIICRNVLIYFTEEAKHLLYGKFSRALKTGGILFVGSTEQIFSPGQYGLESTNTFFYRKKEDAAS